MIELKKVKFNYENQHKGSLNNFSVKIPKGQCVLLCGESGSGKTTVTRLLNGIIPYFYNGKLEGKIEKEGVSLADKTLLDLSKQFGSVFQNPKSQFFNTDTDSEIVFGLENMGFEREFIKKRYDKVVDDLNIRKLSRKSIFRLSGGEKQKVAFASVYALNPEVYILDEPSSNLDFDTIKYLSNIIKKIKKMGKTVIISEHRIYYLMDVIDRIIYIKEGKSVKDLSLEQVRCIENKEWTKLGLRCKNLADVKPSYPNIKWSDDEYEIKNLSHGYNGQEVLKEVSIRANGGEIIAITGKNGAGKSTLAKAICGLINTKCSSFYFNKRKLSNKDRNQISYMVMQDVNHQLFSDTVINECRLGVRKLKDDEIMSALNRVSLEDFLERHPLSLSGGQKQRLAVAISKLSDKKIIIFDEPTSGLDLKGMKQVSKLMISLADEGKIVFVITHDFELVMSSCTRVINLQNGKINFDTIDKNLFIKEYITI